MVRAPTWIYLLGGGLAMGIGLVSGLAAAARVARIESLAALRRE